ncbi:PQQ-binding-like beta-propeller repeat protein [Haladaptatus sp. AB643]|uniref:PQQ-binding-like beta-propeller repeat protein n=1 Tax=Haladaptatus sp. AB643 TaxID=2934174 RepID=UPI00209C44A5|nr:PQQ-binding-like beta-propeller repeat protein [Haladaptatus sp. AB643]MCO8243186.1 PQQ-binding-like beta-propeller repeat protein [Haladaptatus sp. AB643]
MPEDTRRTFLKTVGLAVGATGIAGATGTNLGVLADGDTPSTPLLDDESWTTFQYDAANTGHSPGSAPSEYPFVEWSKQIGDGGDIISPPTIVDGTGYTVDTNGTLTAFDLETRETDWQVSLQNGTPQKDGQQTHNLSPTIVGDVVLASVHGVLHARNISDGSVQWTKAFDNADTENNWILSPTTVTDGTVYVSADEDGLYALDLVDGSERWSVDASGEMYAPAVVDGMAYFVADDGIHALDADDGTEQWHVEENRNPHAALTVADGRVYADNREYVMAYDADDGTERWSYDGSDYFGGSSAYADGTLFCITESGNPFALDGATGTRLWHSSEVGGSSSSLSVADGIVYVVNDGVFATKDEIGAFGLDAKTGDVLWRYQPRDVSHYAYQPASPTIADGTLYVGDDMGYVYALAPTAPDGTNWRFEIASETTEEFIRNSNLSPAVGEETVYSRTGWDVVAINDESGTERWRFEEEIELYLAPVSANGTVFVVGEGDNTGEDLLYALDEQAGTVQWRHSFDSRVHQITASEDGTVYAYSDEQLFALDADTGKQEWVLTGDDCSPIHSPRTDFVVTDDDILYGAYSHLYAIDRTDGTIRWSVYHRLMYTGLAVEDGIAYVGVNGTSDDEPNNVLAFDVADGSELWSTQVTDMPIDGIAVDGDSLYATLGFGETPLLVQLSADDGTERWRFEGNAEGDGVVTAPVAVDDTVYFAANRRVYAFDSDGNRTERWETTGTIAESPVVADDAVYVPSVEQVGSGLLCFVYSFDRDE